MSVATQASPPGEQPLNNELSRFDQFFEITKRGSTVIQEVRAGVIIYGVMSYILFLNPSILSGKDSAGHSLAYTAVLTGTALVGGVMTIIMGMVGRAPLGLATGLGINAFVAYSLVGGSTHLTWPDAMGVVFTEGVVMFVLTMVNDIRERVLNAIPPSLKSAIAVGIGAFILLVALVNAGVIVQGDGTLVGLAPHYAGWSLSIFLFGLIVTGCLVKLKVKAALLYGIVLTTIVATVINTADHYKAITDGSARIPHSFPGPNFDLVGAISFHYWVALGFQAGIAVVVGLVMSDFFDNAGTTYGVLGSAGLLNEDGTLPRARAILAVDAAAAAAGGFCSVSSGTTYIESASGVEAGGRTGLTAVVTGVLFLASLVLAPVAGIVPSVATAPVLVIVACFMLRKVKEIEWDDFRIALPAGFTIFMMPFTYSITDGVGAGLVLYTLISLFIGKGKEVHWMLYIVSAIFCWYFWHGIGV